MDHPKSHNSASPCALFFSPSGASIGAALGQPGEVA